MSCIPPQGDMQLVPGRIRCSPEQRDAVSHFTWVPATAGTFIVVAGTTTTNRPALQEKGDLNAAMAEYRTVALTRIFISDEVGRAFTAFDGDLRTAVKKKKTFVCGKIAPIPVGRALSLFRKIAVKFIK